MSAVSEQGKSTPQHQVPWLELFYDLVVVASVAVLTETVNPLTGLVGEAWIFIASTSLFLIWLLTTFIFNKFPPDDDPASFSDSVWRVTRTTCVFFQMIAVSVVVLAVNQGHEGLSNDLGLLALGFTLLVLATTFILSLRVHHTPAPRVRLVAVLLAVTGVGLIIGSVSPDSWNGEYFGLALLILIAAVIIFVRDHSRPIDFSHLMERFGLLTIIVLGESILTLTLSFAEGHHISNVPLFILAMIFPIAAFVMYFKMPPLEPGATPPILIWVLVQFIVIASFAATGSSLTNRAVHEEFVHLPGSGDKLTVRFVVALVAMAGMCLVGRRITRRPVGVYLVAAAAILITTVVAVQMHWSNESLLLAQGAIFIASVLVSAGFVGSAKRSIARLEQSNATTT